MEIAIRASTTHGKRKKVNQDNYGFRCLKKDGGWAVFSIVCDGVGGLSQGEIASSMVTRRYLEWFDFEFIKIYDQDFDEKNIKLSWENVLREINFQLHQIGEDAGIQLGTTVALLLICNDHYYCMNIGDTRVYRILDKMEQISVDHSLLQMKLDDGTLTLKEAETFPEKNVLFQCIGFNEILEMTFRSGTMTDEAVWIVCSDGFRNRVSEEEIFSFFNPGHLIDSNQFCREIENAVKLNLQRNERDDITLVAIWLSGKKISWEAGIEESDINNEKENDNMYCSKCGCKCRDDDRFCSRCGAPLAGNDEDDDMTRVSGVRIHLDYDDSETQLLGNSSDMAISNKRTSGQDRYQYQETRGLATKKVNKNKVKNEHKNTAEKKSGVSRIILIILCVILTLMILLIGVSAII